MSEEQALTKIHPKGEPQIEGNPLFETPLSLDTFAGKVQFRWVPDRRGPEQGQWVSPAHQGECGAVITKGEMAADSQCRLPVFPSRQGARWHGPAGPSYRLTAVFRFNHPAECVGKVNGTVAAHGPSVEWAPLGRRAKP